MSRPLLSAIGLALAGLALAAPPEATLLRRQQRDPVAMRGFGRVSAEAQLWQTAAGQVARVDFGCQTPETARIVGSKYLADLLAYGAVAAAPALPETGGTALSVRHGGEWLLALEGSRVIVLSAPSRAALAAAAGPEGKAWQPVPAQAYPRYLDNFDNASLGLWWMPTTKTPEQLAWTRTMPVVINLHQQRLGMSPATGVIDMSGTDNAIAQAQAMGKPYRHMLWAGEPVWYNGLQMPGQQMEEYPEGFIGRRFFEAGGYYGEQVASSAVNAIQQGLLVQMMRRRVNDPNLLAWMEPHGEFHQTDPACVPPGCQTRFPAYLQVVKRYSLETVSEAYTGKRDAYSSWTAIPYPDTAWFAGRRGQFMDLDDVSWRWQPGTLDGGEKAGWQQPAFADAAWRDNFRTDRVFLSQWDTDRVQGLWLRFKHSVPQAYLDGVKGRPLYWHVCPYTEQAGGELTLWVNGQEVGRQLRDRRDHINRHTQVDVSKVLRAGDNDFAIYSNGGRIAYRVFLSDAPGEAFPFSDDRLNRRFLDWRDYTTWEKFQTLVNFLRTMRSVDPDRPIKVMTPHLFQSEAMALFERYGAYPQLTGTGAGFYRPMHYKGYSRLYGLPGSSEPGGAQITATNTQGMFANIFWEAQDCHDYVFDLARELWSHPEAFKWWTEHKSLLRTLGKVDFDAPRVGVLRDVTQQWRFGSGLIWSWDLSRGPLPALGLTPVLIDGPAMVEGRADHLPVIFDCATVVMEPAMVDTIHRYVRGGGVFVAQYHCGKDTPLAANAWPLAKSFGLSITPRYLSAENYNQWPLAPIRFTQTQTLLPDLRGKTCEGSGVAIDWQGNAYGGAVAIQGQGSHITPVAHWEDGSLAVVEVREGNGRFILLGTPFFVRFRDEAGKWFNEEQRQALLESLLAGLGVSRETRGSDPRVWFERRVSKNGLYDVYFAGALGVRDKQWQLRDAIPGELRFAPRAKQVAAAILATADGMPDVPVRTAEPGWLSLGQRSLSPFEIQQYAVVRPDAGFEAPLHWLEVQGRTWRALEPVPASEADTVLAEAAKLAAEAGEAGLDLSPGWRLRLDPADPQDRGWLQADTKGGEWRDASMGSWIVQGCPEATRGQYRRQATVPADWLQPGNRLVLDFSGYWSLGVLDTGALWVNGQLLGDNLRNDFAFDVTEAAKAAKGQLDLALQVEAKGLSRGPIGTLALRRTPAPIASVELNGPWERLVDWGRGEGTVPLPANGKVFGMARRVDIPADWAGRPMRLVVEYAPGSSRQLEGIIINRTGYLRTEDFEVLGARLDRWLVAGKTNTIELYGRGFMSPDYKGFTAKLQRIYLQVYPAPGKN